MGKSRQDAEPRYTAKVPTRRLQTALFAVLIGALLYSVLACLPGLFYAWQFDDFVRDEVRFAPTREKSGQTHVVEHILEAAHDCHIAVDSQSVQVVKKRDFQKGVNTLTVDVAYEVPVHLFGYTRNLDRHVEGSVTY